MAFGGLVMKKKWLKGFVSGLNRSEGMALMAVVALMLMMIIMGGAFTSIMGDWKISSPMAIHSNRATQLANSAASFALQEASVAVASSNAVTLMCGSRPFPINIIDDGLGGTGSFWIERPFDLDDDATGGDDDDDVDDDGDDALGASTTYTIIATGKVTSGGTLVAQRLIKVFFDIPADPSSAVTFDPAYSPP